MKLSLISESANCSACGNPTNPTELNSYNGSCEDCWASGIKTKTNSRSVQIIRTPVGSKEYGSASDDKGRDVLDKRKIFTSGDNKGRIDKLLSKPKTRLAILKQDLRDAKLHANYGDEQFYLPYIKRLKAEIVTVNHDIAQIKAKTPTNFGHVGGI